MTATGFLRRMALALFLTAPLISAAKAQEPAPLTLHFDFFYNGIKAAEIVETFTPQNGEYIINSHAKATGLAKLLYGDVIRKSAGRIDSAAGLLPRRYEAKRGKRAQRVFTLDEEAGVLRLQKGEEKRQEPVPDAVLVDYLTALYRPYVLQKMTPGKAAVTDGWRLSFYEYEAGEAEKIQTPLGEITAAPLSRESPRGERIFWLAPEMGYIPVKVYINDKSHRFETIITGIGAEAKN